MDADSAIRAAQSAAKFWRSIERSQATAEWTTLAVAAAFCLPFTADRAGWFGLAALVVVAVVCLLLSFAAGNARRVAREQAMAGIQPAQRRCNPDPRAPVTA